MVRDHAVVLGGGMAGLLAARVLAEEYREVTLVERDTLPVQPGAHRRGVPQGRHTHALLAGGQIALERLLPGVTGELRERGAVTGDLLGEVRWYLRGRRMRRARSGLIAVCATRPLLEGVVRARVLARPNVTVRDGYDVLGLDASPDGHRVVGVRLMRRVDLEAETVPGDLVVDATGRGSRIPRFLAELGYRPPEEERVAVGLGYATRMYEAPPDALGGDMAAVIARFPGQNRGGVLQRVEEDRWLFSLYGILGDHPPVDPDGYLAFARTLSAPDGYEMVRQARPVTQPLAFRFPAYARRRYERLADFPAGLLVLGDAVCSFNPMYAQGMSVAALSACALAEEVSRGEPQPRRYFHALARHLEAPWGIGVGGDLTVPEVAGRRTRASRLMAGYLASLQVAASADVQLARAYIRVNGLVAAPPSLLRPDRALRVAAYGLRRPAPRAGLPSQILNA